MATNSPGWRWRGGFYRALHWERRFHLAAAVTSRAQGSMKDRARWAQVLRRNDLQDWAGGRQVHGRRVRLVRRRAPGEAPATDGLLTARSGLALRIFSADCVAIFLHDPKHRVVGLIHAGWRGAADGILSEAIGKARSLGSRPRDLQITLGPHIRDCCYKVGEEVAGRFPRAARRAGRRGALYLSLERALAVEARRQGVGQFSSAPACTSCDRRFFSYRRDKTRRRQAAFLAIKDRL